MSDGQASVIMDGQAKTLDSGEDNPLINFTVIAYKQERFIRDAVEGAFSQTYSPLEIILSDDCSPDATFEIMKEMAEHYHGPHKVILNRNRENLGLAAHVNIIIERTNTDIIVLAAGDDISLPERAQRTWEIFQSNPSYGCISFSTIKFSGTKSDIRFESDHPIKLKEYDIHELEIDPELYTNGAARSIKKSAIRHFAPLMPITPVEDSPMLFRCLLAGWRAVQASDVQVLYRLHGNNLYASNNKKLMNFELIHLQYMADLYAAFKQKLINDEQLANIITVLNKRLTKYNVKKEFDAAKNKKLFFIKNVLPERHLRLKEKYNLLRKSFL